MLKRVSVFILAVLTALLFITVAGAFICSDIDVVALTIQVDPSPLDAGDYTDDNDWGDDWDDDDDWGDWGDGGSFSWGDWGGSCDGTPPTFTVIIVVIAVVLVKVIITVVNKSTRTRKKSSGAPPRQAEPASLDKLIARDPSFSKQRLLENAGNLYVKMQNAWQAKDFTPMRAYLSEALYNQMKRQLDTSYIALGRTNYVENICVMDSDIVGYSNDAGMDMLTVRLTARIIDYTQDDMTGAIIKGSKTARKLMTYEWTFIRKEDVLTPVENSGIQSINCPSCGAPMEIRYSAKCGYCDNIVSLSEHDWVLSSIKGISQKTIT